MNTRDILAGAGIGAALAFLLDPNGGARRRALVRDKLARAKRVSRNSLDAAARDLGNRARGIAASARGRVGNGPVSDDVLVERVRAQLGRACSHPRAIDVIARDGDVTLRGPILAHEVTRLLDRTGSVRGVQRVINELEPHESSEGVPSLQGEGKLAEPDLDILQRNWAPATRALVGAGVVATGVYLASQFRERSQ